MLFPSLTHLQFAFLFPTWKGELTAKQIQERMKKRGARTVGPMFYQLAARMVRDGLIERVEGDAAAYRITKAGLAEVRRSKAFYKG